ncbi:uncharacterized protein LOC119102976 [Pollicipes pollicipes]|uniref:uncharacterized protein LOC119102976 n=1 Tax=Pollicipes pollicipes TaxID=41117 RepID=UPI001884FF20|nr:uncharacterized protein LOC119102976 [Pollicipes pollicipes]
MSAAASASRGCPSLTAGLLLLALCAYLRPRLNEHAVVLPGGTALPREQQLLTAAGAAVLLDSALGLFWVLALATAALLVTLTILLEARLRAFRGVYHVGFSRALWRYVDSAPLKEYIDRTQSRYQCCGSLGFSDWFVIDWYPLGLYIARYLSSVRLRDELAARGRQDHSALQASFAMDQYGSAEHAELVLAAIDGELRHQELDHDLLEAKLRLGFAEVPFSCCDPASPFWCRQMHLTEPMPAYTPPQNLTIFTAGCSSRVPGFFTWYLFVAGRAALAVAALKLLTAVLARYAQSSVANALESFSGKNK